MSRSVKISGNNHFSRRSLFLVKQDLCFMGNVTNKPVIRRGWRNGVVNPKQA
jgi:hypothetical protein